MGYFVVFEMNGRQCAVATTMAVTAQQLADLLVDKGVSDVEVVQLDDICGAPTLADLVRSH